MKKIEGVHTRETEVPEGGRVLVVELHRRYMRIWRKGAREPVPDISYQAIYDLSRKFAYREQLEAMQQKKRA